MPEDLYRPHEPVSPIDDPVRRFRRVDDRRQALSTQPISIVSVPDRRVS